MAWNRKKRVKLHLFDEKMPSIEGILVGKRHDEYLVGVPKLHFDANGTPAELTAPVLAVPRANVAFYEVL